ncbi:twin-arginine translocase TatA/TatE family subunit [Pseudomonas sp. TWI698]
MGIAGLSLWKIALILLLVIVLLGRKRIRSLGTDLGSALKGFRDSISEDGEASKPLNRPGSIERE